MRILVLASIVTTAAATTCTAANAISDALISAGLVAALGTAFTMLLLLTDNIMHHRDARQLH